MAVSHVTGGRNFGGTLKVVKTPFENERRGEAEI